jgi:hypothetical protein
MWKMLFLSCKEIMLEMNEAEFYRRTAEKKKGPNVQNMIMPLGYLSTYMNAEEAINASDARVAYLNRIYEIMECDDPKNSQGGNARNGAPQPVAQYQPGAAMMPMQAMGMPQQPYYQYQPMSYNAPAAPAQNNNMYYYRGVVYDGPQGAIPVNPGKQYY